MFLLMLFFFKQQTAYEMRISDWSSDVCSSDLPVVARGLMWEQGLPAMRATRSFINRAACFASKLCSHMTLLPHKNSSPPEDQCLRRITLPIEYPAPNELSTATEPMGKSS